MTDKTETVSISREMFDFLLGEQPYLGGWFGDLKAGRRGRFWWRRELRQFDAPAARLTPPTSETDHD